MVISDPKWYLISFGLEMLMHSLYLSLELFHSCNGTLALSAVLKDGARFRLQNGTKPQAWQTLEDVHTRISHLNTVFFFLLFSRPLWQADDNPIKTHPCCPDSHLWKEGQRRRENEREREKQVTRGHNIVADGWTGASNPHLEPHSPPHTNILKKYQNCLLSHFSTRSYGPTNGRTDRRTDGPTKPLIELRVRNL